MAPSTAIGVAKSMAAEGAKIAILYRGSQEAADALVKEIRKHQPPGQECVVVVDRQIRRWFREQTIDRFVDLNVIAKEEIASGFEVRVIARISNSEATSSSAA